MPSSRQVEDWKAQRLALWRDYAAQLPQVRTVAVAATLTGKGHTLDDDKTDRRYVMNKFGELIATRHKRNCEKHAWQPGVRQRVDIA